ncbi:MAG TPA: DUF6152 family protein [Vicinamibacterales bacterium]|jgi:uncharacterized protein DUF6152|nr:DUF6152 family protein [Vicinamibacterales bacterium]
MRKTALFVVAVVLSAAIPSFAHHAFSAEFDQAKPVKVQGEISRLEWTNPHAWLFIDSKDKDGKAVTWRFEMGAPNALLRAGWSKSDIKPGTQVTVSGFMARSGGSVGNAYQVRLPDGRDLFAASSLKDAESK